MVTKQAKQVPLNRRLSKKRRAPGTSLWLELEAVGKRLPKEVLASLPKDYAEHFDHYHDGSPKQQ
jgi:hypothetical protein